MEDRSLDEAIDAALASPKSMRRVVASVAPPGPHSVVGAVRRARTGGDVGTVGLGLDPTFDELLGRAAKRLGDPIFDDRRDRAAIDTWYPAAARFAAWPRPGGLVLLAAERDAEGERGILVVGHATDDEIDQRRRYAGHAPADVEAAPTAAPNGPPARGPAGIATALGAERLGGALRRPEGLNRLSQRPRDRAIRWLFFVAAVVVVIGAFTALVVARHG